MNAGIILKNSTEEETQIVFLSAETECKTTSTNDEIIELIQERKPSVVAVDTGTRVGRDEFSEQEEELKQEGYSFTPTSHETKKARRLEALKARLFEEMGASQPEVIRFEPEITAEELALHDDQALESLGVDPSSLENSEQFDAMLGAVTARFYEQNQVRDLGVVIPEPLGDS